MAIRVRPKCEVVNGHDTMTAREERKGVVRRVNRRRPDSPRERGQPELFPEKPQGHGLNEPGRHNHIAVHIRERLLVARLADHDKREPRTNRLAGQFLDISTDAASLRTDRGCVHENERLSRRFLHSPSLLPHYAEERGRR